MQVIEFEMDLTGNPRLIIPEELLRRLPTIGKARIIMLYNIEDDEQNWRLASYEQFIKDEDARDSIYDKYL